MIFIDTGAFISKYIEKDQHHKKSLLKWNTIIHKAKLFTSNHVIDETITFLLRKTTPPFAMEKANILYKTDVYKILHTDIEIEMSALRVLEKYKDQDLSFTDCMTIALMKKYKINKIFTFDKHFQLFNFTIL